MAQLPADPPTFSPWLYNPSCERLEEDELDTIDAIVRAMYKIAETTYQHAGRASRAVHAKSHGLLRGELEVLDGLPACLAQGLFATPRRYPIAMRLSTTPGDILRDSVSVPRGLAIKVIGVEGERLQGSEGDVTQDFLMVNSPAFLSPDLKHFLRSVKPVAATTNKAPGAKQALSALLRWIERVIEAFGGQSAMLKSLGGHPATHILGETFYTQVPLRHGQYIAKLSLAPISPGLLALKDAPVSIKHQPNALREAVSTFFREQGGTWELRVQLCVDPALMPVEDSSVVWSEARSPYLPVARIVVPPQVSWNDALSPKMEDGLAFNPWHGLAAHRPLGSIMRARKAAYEASARFRSHNNGRTVAEPREAAQVLAFRKSA